MTSSESSRPRYAVGERVVYSAEGKRIIQPPAKVVGEVVEDDGGNVMVRWPMGLGVEDPQHIRPCP